jgi:hypothetical protein
MHTEHEANYFWCRNSVVIVRIFRKTSIWYKWRNSWKCNGGFGASGKTINSKNGTSANDHGIGGTTNSRR